jgi:hypothetical protein
MILLGPVGEMLYVIADSIIDLWCHSMVALPDAVQRALSRLQTLTASAKVPSAHNHRSLGDTIMSCLDAPVDVIRPDHSMSVSPMYSIFVALSDTLGF